MPNLTLSAPPGAALGTTLQIIAPFFAHRGTNRYGDNRLRYLYLAPFHARGDHRGQGPARRIIATRDGRVVQQRNVPRDQSDFCFPLGDSSEAIIGTLRRPLTRQVFRRCIICE